MPALRLPLLIAYPVLAHASVMVHSLPLEWAALTALAAGCLYAGLSERRWKTWLAFLAIAAVLAVLTEAGGGRYALYLPSLVAPLLVLLPFAESLLPGRTPLVSRIARLVHGPLPPAVVGYTRRVTWLWVLAIVLLSGIDIALMAFASRETWSLYANGLAYLLLAAVFVGEYLWRRWRFRGIDHPGFAEYLRLVVRNPPHLSRP